jgi:5-methylcytosine-specific restriction enzyme A
MPIQDADHWYDTQRWRRRARLHLAANPLCEMCKDEGVIEPVVLCDHIVAHRNGKTPLERSNLFWFGAIRGLCQKCHSSTKQRLENGSRIVRVGVDGSVADITEELRNRWMRG